VGVFPKNPKDHFLQHNRGMADGTKDSRWKCWWVALTATQKWGDYVSYN